MDQDFAGKSVLVTGAARGLGRATALAFARRGARLTIVDIEAERLEQTRVDILAVGAEVEAIAADIAHRETCVTAVARAVERHGRLDVLCNVAAVLRFHAIAEVTQDQWERIMAVNVSAPFYFCQAAIPHLLASHGNIVNVTSQGALLGSAFIVPYATSKAALLHMTRCMAMEYVKQPIRINAVSPGTMKTEISAGLEWPRDVDKELVQRFSGVRPPGEPEDVAEVIVFVASDQARAIHGACVPADQGATTG